MSNFDIKHGNVLVNTNEQVSEVSEKYDAAIKKIKQLECQLNQRSIALSTMTENLENCVTSLNLVKNKLHTIAMHSDSSNKHIFELIQENKLLRLSGDEWFRRAIKLEFEALIAKDELNEIESQHNLAMKTIKFLQVELMSVVKKNN